MGYLYEMTRIFNYSILSNCSPALILKSQINKSRFFPKVNHANWYLSYHLVFLDIGLLSRTALLERGKEMPKILIADDENHIRVLLEQTLEDLEDEGVDLYLASNGQEALENIMEELPDLVLLDVMMPKMNGFEVCSKVKIELGMPDIYIILLTAKGQEFDKQKGQEVGADQYITKPFNPDEIVKKAREVLRM